MQLAESERVLVVPTERFHELGHFQGFTTDVEKYVLPLLHSPEVTYLPRSEMEEDPGYKQLIPYVVFQHRDAAGNVSVFQYTRGTGQGEGRLHRLRSIGVGGHISTLDAESASSSDVYDAGMQRELEEEVEIDTPFEATCVGLINDDQTPVGRVHLGVVHLFDVEQPHVRPREDEILAAGFRPVEELVRELEQFETWSQIAIRALFA